jgi:hypothetical protein
MNDELNNQLTSQWQIPAFAREKLYVTTQTDSAQVSGENGLFSLSEPTTMVTIRWGSTDGTPLCQLRWRADSLEWSGFIRVGGMVDAMHYTSMENEETALAIITASVCPLFPNTARYPRLNISVSNTPRVDYFEGLDREQEPRLITWLVPYLSPLLPLCQDALSNKLMVYFWGYLADKGNLDRMITPFILQEMTLFQT